MTALRRWLPLAAVLGVLLAAAGWILSLRLSGGNMFPPYSSLRADALGTRALHDGLAALEAFEVDRDYRPLPKLSREPRTILLAGLNWRQWRDLDAEEFEALELAARSGSRVILAFTADLMLDEGVNPAPGTTDGADGKSEKAKKKSPEEKTSADKRRKRAKTRTLEESWDFSFRHDWLISRTPTAERADGADESLPPSVGWKSDLHFRPADDSAWRTIYRRAGAAVMIERAVGAGTIVMMGDAYAVSNEALHVERPTALLSWLIGPHHRVTFVESTLGVLRDNGVGFLARRYGLGGALALTVLLGALYAWRRGVAFVPPTDDAERSSEIPLTYEPAAGFTALLRRALKAEAVLPACMDAWRKSRRGGQVPQDARVEEAWKNAACTGTAETYNSLVRASQPR